MNSIKNQAAIKNAARANVPKVVAQPKNVTKPTPQPASKLKTTKDSRVFASRPARVGNAAPITKSVAFDRSDKPNISDKFHNEYNSYWNTLQHPDVVHGVKIPDVNFQASGTVTTVEKTSVVSSAAGVMGVAIGAWINIAAETYSLPSEVAWGGGNNSTYKYVMGGISGTTAVAADIFSTANTTAGMTPWQASAFMSGATAGPMVGIANQLRMVSQKLTVEQTASATTNGGFYTAASLPGDFFVGTGTDLSTLTAAERANLPGAIRSSISDGPISLLYVPTDNGMLEYCDPHFAPSTVEEKRSHSPSFMFVQATGVTSGVTFLVTLTTNWEFLPQSSNALFGISPSTVDRLALDYALTHAQTMDLSYVDDHVNTDIRASGLESSFTGADVALHPAGKMVLTKSKGAKFKNSKSLPAKAPVGRTEVKEMTLFDHIVEDVASIAKKVLPAVASWF